MNNFFTTIAVATLTTLILSGCVFPIPTWRTTTMHLQNEAGEKIDCSVTVHALGVQLDYQSKNEEFQKCVSDSYSQGYRKVNRQ